MRNLALEKALEKNGYEFTQDLNGWYWITANGNEIGIDGRNVTDRQWAWLGEDSKLHRALR